MKIAVIGAGNIGSSLVKNLVPKGNAIKIFDPDRVKLEALKSDYPSIELADSNVDAITGAEFIFLVVKPYIVPLVFEEIGDKIARDQILISTAAGVGTEQLAAFTSLTAPSVYYIIPNIAISKGESMTFLSSARSDESKDAKVYALLEELGKVMPVSENLMGAYMALSSCGIAYALRYVRAATVGAVELGIRPSQAQEVICQTLKGAIALLEGGAHPEAEIDKVTTPGGFTIKGLNAMEAGGFTTSVIEGLKASKI